MTTLPSAINDALRLQDTELAAAWTALKTSGGPAVKAWVDAQQAAVKDQIVKQKEDTFEKVYGDFDRSTKVEDSILMHNKRTSELKEMVDKIYSNQESGAQAVVQDKDLASRKKEMNEWSVENKQDTLFVFSSLFIVLSGLLLITGLWRMGMISSALWVAIGAPLVIIFLLILVRRWRYTEVLRNKRYWNKQIFEGKQQPRIAMPSCAQLYDGLSSMRSRIGDTAASLTGAGAGTGAGTGAGAGAPVG
jgi:hypothetical protein